MEDTDDFNCGTFDLIVKDVACDLADAATGKKAIPPDAGLRMVGEFCDTPLQDPFVAVVLLLAPVLKGMEQNVGEIDTGVEREEDRPLRARLKMGWPPRMEGRHEHDTRPT